MDTFYKYRLEKNDKKVSCATSTKKMQPCLLDWAKRDVAPGHSSGRGTDGSVSIFVCIRFVSLVFCFFSQAESCRRTPGRHQAIEREHQRLICIPKIRQGEFSCACFFCEWLYCMKFHAILVVQNSKKGFVVEVHGLRHGFLQNSEQALHD